MDAVILKPLYLGHRDKKNTAESEAEQLLSFDPAVN